MMKATFKSLREAEMPHIALALLMLTGMLAAWTTPHLLHDAAASKAVLGIAIGIASVPLLFDLLRQMMKGNFNVDLLAAISVVSAILFDEYWVAAIVVLMLAGGKALEGYARGRASSVLSALVRRMPHVAHRIQLDGSSADCDIESIAVGDKLAIHPHELCPVDGVVIGGDGTMDESYLTGEPFLISKAPGATVLSGAINGSAVLTIRATRVASESRYAKVMEVLHASEKTRPRMRRLGDRIGTWYTPATIAIAALTWLVSGEPDRFLAVLVIATPCPLLLAIPIAILGAISVSARRGIIIKDPSILEKVGGCRTLIVDKTGTLTYGTPVLTEVICYGEWSRSSILQFAASLDQYSKHPLAKPLIAAAKAECIPLLVPEDVFELPGQGLRAHVDGHILMLTGRRSLPDRFAKRVSDAASGLECVVLIDGELAGLMRFQDEPRAESHAFLQHVRLIHRIRKVVLLSGDRPSEVAHFAARMEIAQEYGGKSPEEKLEIVRELTREAPTLYIGDGINDAPAMMHATAGVALGVNSEITSEAAGAVVLQSSLKRVDELIHIGERMKHIALVSAVGGMGLSLAGMIACALGYLRPLEGAIVQEGIDLLAIVNALRMILPVKAVGDFLLPAEAESRLKSQASPLIVPSR